MTNKALFLALLIFALFSCDKVDAPYLENINGNVPPTASAQKVLLEEFTGHKCTNCPKAHLEARNIQLLNPGSVIVVSIHAGYFATFESAGLYTADYTTDAGDEINDAFTVSSNPIGMINRTKFGGTFLQSSSSWQGYTDEEITKTAKASITLETEWNSTTREVKIDPKISFTETVEGVYNIVVLITEDSIQSPQANNDASVGATPVINPYYHRHVLRKAINGTWGEVLNSQTGITSGTIFTKSYTFAVPQNWNENHCSVVAYISRMDQVSEKYAVIQVEETHVVHSK